MNTESRLNWNQFKAQPESRESEEKYELPSSEQKISERYEKLESGTLRFTFNSLKFDKPATEPGTRHEMPPETRKNILEVLLKVQNISQKMLKRTPVESDPTILGDVAEVVDLGLKTAIKEKRESIREITFLPTEEAAKKQLAAWIDNSAFQEIIPEEDELLARFGRIDFDVNGLKAVNDALGHVAGDAYLKNFADFLRDNPAAAEWKEKYGLEMFPFHRSGDEFGLILKSNQHRLDTEIEVGTKGESRKGKLLDMIITSLQQESEKADVPAVDLTNPKTRKKLQKLINEKSSGEPYQIQETDKHILSMSAGGMDARQAAYLMLEHPDEEFSKEAYEKNTGGGWHDLSFGEQLTLGMSRVSDQKAAESKSNIKKVLAEKNNYMKTIFSIR